MKGICYLVGAGPGAPDLVTLKARRLIEKADVLVYDALVQPEVVSWSREGCERIYVGKRARKHTLRQEDINRLIGERAQEGKIVVRLKGGDPYVFGRGGEEAVELVKMGVPFEVVPAVTAGVGASAYAGIPVTHRECTSAVTFVTGHEDPDKESSLISWKALAESGATLVIYMGMDRLGRLAERLIRFGMDPELSVGVVQWGTTRNQRKVSGSLGTIARIVEEAGLGAPSIVIIGKVVDLQGELSWLENKPLFGMRFLLTRTRKQASRLKLMLEEMGGEVWELPTIRVEFKKISVVRKLRENRFDWLVFTSPNGVDSFFSSLMEEGDVRMLSGIKVASVGPATRKKLREWGIQPEYVPEIYTADGLVKDWPDSGTAKALFPCGDLAGKEVENGLRELGVEVDRWEIYQTLPETEDASGIRTRLCEEGVDWIVFASSSAVENFVRLGLEFPECHFASLGPTTSRAIEKAGWSVDFQSEESTIPSMVEGLANYLKRDT